MNVREKLTSNYLKAWYVVHTVSKPTQMYQQHDLFNLWDHVAVENATGVTIFVQTKSRKQYGKDFDKYKDFPCKDKFIFIWIKRGGKYWLTIQEFEVKWEKPYNSMPPIAPSKKSLTASKTTTSATDMKPRKPRIRKHVLVRVEKSGATQILEVSTNG